MVQDYLQYNFIYKSRNQKNQALEKNNSVT